MQHAKLGLAGEVKGVSLAGARCGIAGLNDIKIISAGEIAANSGSRALPRGGLGIAGNLGSGPRLAAHREVVDPSSFMQRDATLAALSKSSRAVGDQAVRSAWSKAVWFADYSYLVKPDHQGGVTWKKGRDAIFYRRRDIPLFIDSSGYRREISGTAPAWVRQPSSYPAAIELIQPDGYAAYDYPGSRERSLKSLAELKHTFPADITNGKMWPVFSIRWTWDDHAYFDGASLPSWWTQNLAALIPMNRTQRPISEATREGWARLAIANAQSLRDDPDFRAMCDEFGHVMLGGMVHSQCPRLARHLFAATLCHLFPDVQFWMLGQASFGVVNGLGQMDVLSRVSVDGSWWILESTQSKLALLDSGLLTMLNLRSRNNKSYEVQHFMSLVECLACNLRALLSAYEGLWEWPKYLLKPVNLDDPDERHELKKQVQAAQLELNLGEIGSLAAGDD